jgi:hypothetical protein
MRSLTLLDVVNTCDNVHLNRPPPRGLASTTHDSERPVRFQLSPSPDSPKIGLLRPAVVDRLRAENARSAEQGLPEAWWVGADRVSFSARLDTPCGRTDAMAEMLLRWRDVEDAFPDVVGHRKWRGELYPVFADPFGQHHGAQDGSGNFLFAMERSACALFGVVTYGVHMTVYEGLGPDVKVWVPRRAQTKQTYVPPGWYKQADDPLSFCGTAGRATWITQSPGASQVAAASSNPSSKRRWKRPASQRTLSGRTQRR